MTGGQLEPITQLEFSLRMRAQEATAEAKLGALEEYVALLDELRPEGDFEDLGEEPVDGVTTRHFRSASPEDLPIDAIRDWVRNRGDVTALDIWVDEDDLVRRLEIGFAGGDPNEAGPNETPVSASTASIRLYDFGEVPPLEAPPVDVEP